MASPTRTVPELLQSIVGNVQEITLPNSAWQKWSFEKKARSSPRRQNGGDQRGLRDVRMGFVLLSATSALAIVVSFWMGALIVGVGRQKP